MCDGLNLMQCYSFFFTVSAIYGKMVSSQLKMEGFIVTRYQERWSEAITALAQWVKEVRMRNY